MAKKAIDPRILESRRYWAEREEANRKATIRDEQEYAKSIREVLEKAAANIRKEIDAFYGRYAAREGITISDAKMRVSALDIKEYSRKAKQYVAEKDFSKQANEEMRIYNLTMKINRLEMLKSNIGLELCASYSDLEKNFGDSLTKTARKEFRRQAGILGGTVANMEKHAGEIVNGSFRGAKFSERLWANQAYLKMQLDNLLRTGLVQGRNPRELAKGLRKEIETSVYAAERLMRTEMCRVQIGAQLASYTANGYDRLVIVPEHDERSCDYCETQDGVVVEVAKAVPGVNVPPFHPNCRCSTAAWAEDGDMSIVSGGHQEEIALMSRREDIGEWPEPGERISQEKLQELVEYGAKYRIDVKDFDNFDGDIELLKRFIDGIVSVAQDYPEILPEKRHLQFRCSYQEKPEDYAKTTRGCIIINGNAYRNETALDDDYKRMQAKEAPFFVMGTTYKNIPHHEAGHLVIQTFGLSAKKITKGIDTKKISDYASSRNDEAVAESFSAYYAKVHNETALMVKERCDTIIAERRAQK